MGVLENLEPKNVWRHFEQICSIPHPSGHEELLADYIVNFAKGLGLEAKKDPTGNVLVVKPAKPGLEGVPTIVLQSHIDMVPVARQGVSHDFLKEGIRPKVEGEFVRAHDTTLGGDNGIGAALMLALMEEESQCGKLELLFTINEEVGMDGARGLTPEFVTGQTLINLDTEDWGEIYISCAGGGDSVVSLPLERKAPEDAYVPMEIVLTGLKGGHSGCDIHLGRGSANKLIGRMLKATGIPIVLRSLHGGNKRNSISDGAKAWIDVPAAKKETFVQEFNKQSEIVKQELSNTDPGFKAIVQDAPEEAKKLTPCTKAVTEKVIDLLCALPQGIIAMSPQVPGLVQTSTNMGVIGTEENKFMVAILSRSAVDSEVDATKLQIKTIASMAGASVEEPIGYPGWKPNMASNLLQITKKTYTDLYKEEPKIKAIHAGLECGLFAAKFPNMDMVSIGPTVKHPHTPDEEVHIPTVSKSYDFLKAVLKSAASQIAV